MELLTKEIREKFRSHPCGCQDGKYGEAEILAKYFLPCTRWTWMITEAEEMPNGDFYLYGYVLSGLDVDFDEWGGVMLSELEELSAPRPFDCLGVERDIHMKKGCTVNEMLKEMGRDPLVRHSYSMDYPEEMDEDESEV
ncbi:MAG: DUF2958 domain-containing protein [Holdemanella sp.]|nr:DUF2958 domain-containing protein [Holdemanella sp.]